MALYGTVIIVVSSYNLGNHLMIELTTVGHGFGLVFGLNILLKSYL